MKILPIIPLPLSLALAATLFAGPVTALAAEPPPGAPKLSVSVSGEEAIGPFASWGNVKTQYGAKGDGVTDDTAALQRALDDMNLMIVNVNNWKIEKAGSPAVLYFPAGSYRITRPLLSKNQYGASLIGENPANTKILWDGAVGGTMLIADGVFGGKYARLTWDGNKKAGIGVAHWWNRKTPQYGGSPEHVDEVFVDLGVGIVAGCCGTSSTTVSHPGSDWLASEYGNLDSEGSVKRTKFIRNTVAGVSTESYNALDWWVMDSEFIDCYRGVTNALGAGNVLAYRNLFQRSKFADIHVGTPQWHSMHGNVSIGSLRFLHANSAGNNGRSLILKNNRILNPTDPSPIFIGGVGPLIMIDNQILSPAGSTGPLIRHSNYNNTPGVDILMVGNQITLPDTKTSLFSSTTPSLNDKEPNRLALYDTTNVAPGAISRVPPTLPGTANNLGRKVFEVAVTTNPVTLTNDTTAEMIQAVISQAAASTDANPVVHLPRATYTLNASLVIPANRRIQLAGDGLATILKAGPKLGDNPLIRLAGPSLATVREIRLYSTSYDATAVTLDKADQAGGRILFVGGMHGVTKLSNLASTKVEFQHSTTIKKLNAGAAASVLALGTGGTGPVSVNANSNVMLLDSWYEGPNSDPILGGKSGNFTYLGGHIAPPDFDAGGVNKAGASVVVDNFAGRFTVMGLSYEMKTPEQGIVISNEVPATKALFMGVSANLPEVYYKRASIPGAGTVGFGMMRVDRVHPQPDYGATDKAAVLAGIAQLRSQQWDLIPTPPSPAGTTDVLFYRVRTIETKVGYDISGQ